MTFETFKQVIELLKIESEKIEKLYNLEIDLYNFVDIYHSIINMLLRSHYSCDGEDIISWWLYEDTEKKLYDCDGNEINDLTNIEDLWKYVEEIRKSPDFVEYIPKPNMTDDERQIILKNLFK